MRSSSCICETNRPASTDAMSATLPALTAACCLATKLPSSALKEAFRKVVFVSLAKAWKSAIDRCVRLVEVLPLRQRTHGRAFELLRLVEQTLRHRRVRGLRRGVPRLARLRLAGREARCGKSRTHETCSGKEPAAIQARWTFHEHTSQVHLRRRDPSDPLCAPMHRPGWPSGRICSERGLGQLPKVSAVWSGSVTGWRHDSDTSAQFPDHSATRRSLCSWATCGLDASKVSVSAELRASAGPAARTP